MNEKDEKIKEGKSKNEFNAQRTPFWISFGWLWIEAIIPAFLIWFLMGKDFSFSFFKDLAEPKELWVVLACLLVIAWSIFSTMLFFYLNWHESDNFTFAFITSMVMTSFIYNGLWLGNSPSGIVLKAFLGVFILIGSGILGAMLTALMRNQDNKRQEDLKVMYQAFKNNETIPEKKLLKIRRYEDKVKKNQEREAELAAFRKELQRKISDELNEREKSKINYQEKVSKELDSKEINQSKKKK
ncbi:DxFTY motif-containing membrane protein [Spiroplasma alleghenense]|uniref:Transmembrane protein n=1 Tax=Spiroplasma alleghenense TaxID=216931 RepID=A0A345Z3R9_9MOLU|nr:hypothetical protein [Spiroplasma alleghenense]AXK51248.1 hypothetical protein SALLE_v1c05760 [Spiroplasma alleghenense]